MSDKILRSTVLNTDFHFFKMFIKCSFSLQLALILIALKTGTIFAQEIPIINPEVCLPNPPQTPVFSGPFATCEKSARESLIKRHPDQNLNTPEILGKYGYSFITYTIITEDNYILTVYRIYASPVSKAKSGKQAVYINHGMGAASDCWNFQPGSRNLPFKLADAGYEVWLGNCRGTTYSLKHKTLDANKNISYWDFSWDQMGLFDVPVITKTILEETNQTKIFYVGHSMGTTQYFVALSEIPEMNNKIHAGFLLAPIAYIGHMNNLALRLLVPFIDTDLKYQIVNTALMGRVQSAQQIRQQFKVSAGDLCAPTATQCGVCDNLIFLFFGYDAPQMNNTELPNIVAKTPNNISVKALAHYAQLISSCKFKKYDYGPAGNLKTYNSSNAPDYNLQNIKAPTHFFFGEEDNFGPPNDVHITASKLKPGVLRTFMKVKFESFNHVDFILAKNADELVYNKILSEMKLVK